MALASRLIDPSSPKSHDLVDRIETFGSVGDQQDGAAFGGVKGIVDEPLRRLLIQVRRGFIEDNDGAVRQERPCQSDPATLAARHHGSLLADERVPSIW